MARIQPGFALSAVTDSVTTPFEDWCDAHRVHPEAFGAWETYEAELVALRTLAAS